MARKPIETVGVHAVLIVNEAAPTDVVYGMTKALFNPANRAALDGLVQEVFGPL